MAVALHSLKDIVEREIERFRNRHFLEASMAAGALMAYADGVPQASERARLDALLDELRLLQPFDLDSASVLYDRYLEALRLDGDGERERILELVGRFADDPQAADTLLRVGFEIGTSDRHFQQSEYGALAELARALRVDLSSLSG